MTKAPLSFDSHSAAMRFALEKASEAGQAGEIPICALITEPQSEQYSQGGLPKERLIAWATNKIESAQQSTFHAELLAIQAASKLMKQRYLSQCNLYVTLEPCAMCAAAIAHARLARLYYAAYDVKSGGVDQGARVFDHPQCHHKPEVISGFHEQEAQKLLQDFFRTLRNKS